MKCFIDGNALCITRDNFVNLQENPAVFIDLTESQIIEIQQLNMGKDKVVEPIELEDQWQCGICGCSHRWKENAIKCNHGGRK